MRKENLFLFTLLLFMLSSFSVAAESIGVGFQLTDTQGPLISIEQPLNKSGHQQNLSIEFIVNDASAVDNCTLFLDGSQNQTRVSPAEDTPIRVPLNGTSLGRHNWTVRCMDSLGYASDPSHFIFYVWRPYSFNGSTTNLSSANIENISSFVVERQSIGKINLSQDVDLSNITDLEQAISISYNFLSVDAEEHPSLNKQAVLTFEGIALTNPRMLRNNQACSASICTFVSFSQGRYVALVSQFSNYSLEETPIAATPNSPAGSGGGGGGGGGSYQALNITAPAQPPVENASTEGVTPQEANETTPGEEKTPYLESLLSEPVETITALIKEHPYGLTFGLTALIFLLGIHLAYISYFPYYYSRKKARTLLHSPPQEKTFQDKNGKDRVQ